MENKTQVLISRELEELIPSYIENRKNEISVLQEALGREDFAFLQRLAHQVRGHGSAYGFERISRLGTQIEEASKEKDAQAIREFIQQFADYLSSIEVIYY